MNAAIREVLLHISERDFRVDVAREGWLLSVLRDALSPDSLDIPVIGRCSVLHIAAVIMLLCHAV